VVFFTTVGIVAFPYPTVLDVAAYS